MKMIFITDATGFIGSNLAERLFQTEQLCQTVLALPMGPYLGEDDLIKITKDVENGY